MGTGAAGRAGTRRTDVAFAAVLVVVLLLWNNIVVHRVPGGRGSYVAVNVAAAGVLLDQDELTALDAAVPRDAVVGARYGDMSHIDA